MVWYNTYKFGLLLSGIIISCLFIYCCLHKFKNYVDKTYRLGALSDYDEDFQERKEKFLKKIFTVFLGIIFISSLFGIEVFIVTGEVFIITGIMLFLTIF